MPPHIDITLTAATSVPTDLSPMQPPAPASANELPLTTTNLAEHTTLSKRPDTTSLQRHYERVQRVNIWQSGHPEDFPDPNEHQPFTSVQLADFLIFPAQPPPSQHGSTFIPQVVRQDQESIIKEIIQLVERPATRPDADNKMASTNTEHNTGATSTKDQAEAKVPNTSPAPPSLAWAGAPEFKPRQPLPAHRQVTHRPSPLRKEVIPSPTTPIWPTTAGLIRSSLSSSTEVPAPPSLRKPVITTHIGGFQHQLDIPASHLRTVDPSPGLSHQRTVDVSNVLPIALAQRLRIYESIITPSTRSSLQAVPHILPHFLSALYTHLPSSLVNTNLPSSTTHLNPELRLDRFIAELQSQVCSEALREYLRCEGGLRGLEMGSGERRGMEGVARLVALMLAWRVEVGRTAGEYPGDVVEFVGGFLVG